jgi:pimeloyl-ACP methyl ester carboxylesterase
MRTWAAHRKHAAGFVIDESGHSVVREKPEAIKAAVPRFPREHRTSVSDCRSNRRSLPEL